MGYTNTAVNYELKVINFLLGSGKITSEEASYLRRYIKDIFVVR